MVAYLPAPELCQGADEDIISQIAGIIFPDFIERNQAVNGLRLKLDGDYRDKSLIKIATDQFQILLGILRAWNPLAGQRVDEVRPGIGAGSIHDEHGNQLVRVGSAIEYVKRSEVEAYGRDAKVALDRSLHIRNAAWLHGRRDRNAADFYMIYEYAAKDFGNDKAVAASLGLSRKDIKRLTNSANHLAPMDGGRHAREMHIVEWDLERQKVFIANFLKSWIEFRARMAS